jgi:hypothetical protein
MIWSGAPRSKGAALWAGAWGDIGWLFSGEVASGIAWHCERPGVAMGGIGALIAYQGDSGSNPLVFSHVHGRRWVLHSTFLPQLDMRR